MRRRWRALSKLGLDDCKGVGVAANGLPDIGWVEIPGGGLVCQGRRLPQALPPTPLPHRREHRVLVLGTLTVSGG